ncbi:MAG: ABC transporter permease [Candidatus Heimdallarchaeaceae archaeon]
MNYINFLTNKTFKRRIGKNTGTLIVIALGVTLMAGVQITLTSFTTQAVDYFVGTLGETDIIMNNLTLPIDNYPQIVQTIDESNITYAAITGRIVQRLTAYNFDNGQIERNVNLVGIDVNESTVFKKLYDENLTEYTEERFKALMNNNQSVLISQKLKEQLDVDVGSELTLRVTRFGDYGQITYFNYNVTIKGIVANEGKGKEYNQEALWTDITYMREFSGMREDQVTDIFIALSANHKKNPILNDYAYKVKDQLNEMFNGPTTGLLILAIRATTLDTAKDILNQILLGFNLFGSLVLFAGLLLIVNIQLIQVEDRIHQLGILRAIGSRKKEVIQLFLFESLILGTFGSIAGLGGGYALAEILVNQLEKIFSDTGLQFYAMLTPFGVGYSIILGVTLSVVAGVFPAIRAAQVDAIEVIRGIKKVSLRKLGFTSLPLGLALVLSAVVGFSVQSAAYSSYFSCEGWDSSVEQIIFTGIGLLFILGISLLIGYLFSKKLMGNFLGFAMFSFVIWMLLERLPNVKDIRENNRLLILNVMLLAIASIIIVGVNLNKVTGVIQKVLFQTRIKKGIALIASKYMTSKSLRSILTYGIFTLVLSMNIFSSIYQTSYSYNTLDQLEFYAGGASIFVDLETPVSNTSLVNVTEALCNIDPAITHVEGIRAGLTVAYDEDPVTNTSATPFPASLDLISDSTFKKNGEYFYDFIVGNSIAQFSREYKPGGSETYKLEYSHKIWEFFYNRTKFNREGYIDNKNGLPTVLSASPFYDPGDVLYLVTTEGYKEFIVLAQIEQYPFALSSGLPKLLIPSQLEQLFISFVFIKSPNEYLIKTSVPFRSEKNKEIAEKIENFFNAKDSILIKNGEFVAADAYSIWDIMLQIIDFQYKTFDYLQYFVSFGLVVGALGMVIIAIRNVSERRREIGMMRAIGFRRKQIIGNIILELLILSMLGLFMGVINGVILGWGLARLYGWRMVIPFVRLVIYSAIMIGIALIASIIPGIQASRVTPAEALRYVG